MYSTIIRAFALIASFSNIVNGQAEGLVALNRFAKLTTADPAQASIASGGVVAYLSSFVAQPDVAPVVSQLASFGHQDPSVYSAAESLFPSNPAQFVSVYLSGVPQGQTDSAALAYETSLATELSSILNQDITMPMPAATGALGSVTPTSTGSASTKATATSGASAKSAASSTSNAGSSSVFQSASTTITPAIASKAGAAAMVTGGTKAVIGAAVAAGAVGMVVM